jgi:hypothetical protein
MAHLRLKGLLDSADGWPQFAGADGIRLRFDQNGMLSDPSAIPGLKSVRLNWPGHSIIIEYDPGMWPFVWVDELMTTQDPERVQAIVEAMAAKMGMKVSWS